MIIGFHKGFDVGDVGTLGLYMGHGTNLEVVIFDFHFERCVGMGCYR